MKIRAILTVVGALAALTFTACQSLPFKDDFGYLVSAQANSHEFPVYINGRLCTDTDGYVGLCAKRVKSTEDIVFRFDPQQYAWLMTVKCTTGVRPVLPGNVEPNKPYTFTIKADDFKEFRSFTCTGEVSPQDREEAISAKWQVRVVVVDSEYEPRERIYTTTSNGKSYLVLGQFARHSWVKDANGWRKYRKATVVEIEGDLVEVKAYSESFAMRFNFLNLGTADGGPSGEE